MLVDAVGRAHRQTTANKARWRAPDALAEPDDAKALAALGSRFDDALGRLWMAYQPIIQRSSRTLFAYEAFVRANEPTFDGPADLFRAARLLGRSRRLEQTIRAATHPAVAATQALVFVNLASDGLTDDELFSPASPLAAVAHRVVFELSERALLENIKDIPARIAALRRLGFRIALNDMGSGHSGLNTFAAIDPEIIKLDMTLTRGIESSATKRRVVKSIVSLCENGGTVVVAEGVESQEELDTLSGLGCDYFQGYFFAKAGPAFPEVAW
jgi:EAL domain-containing protein (putative c-di-GMP-specific phosphodiesterase class I)